MWGNTITVDTVSDVGVEVCIYDAGEGPERVSVRGSTTGQGSHGAVLEALARAGYAVVDDRRLNDWSWEPGEAEGEEVAFVRAADLDRRAEVAS